MSGIVRGVDKLGRICLPIEWRKQFGIAVGGTVNITTTAEGILVRSNNVKKESCPHCGETLTQPR